MPVNLTEKDGCLVFGVRVVPRASNTEFAGGHDGYLKVRIASPPVDGAANSELIRFLAKKFGMSRADITIMSGETSKNKRIMIANLSQSKFDEVTQ